MTKRPSPNRWRRRPGYLALVALLIASTAIAQSASTPPVDAAPPMDGHDHGFMPPPPPPFPPDAMRNRAQGIVMLKVLVATDGTPRKVDVDGNNGKASPELAKAAGDAAMKWHFHPPMDGGKTVEGWIKVPVLFSLSALPPRPPGAPDGPMPPPPPPGGFLPPPPPPPPMAPPTSSSS